VVTKARSAFLLLAATLALGVLVPSGALAQSVLFNDDFGPKPLGSWQASPLGLLGNWDATGANGLQALLPNTSTAGTLASLTLNGSAVTFTTQTIKGIAYAVFPAASGAYVATYAP